MRVPSLRLVLCALFSLTIVALAGCGSADAPAGDKKASAESKSGLPVLAIQGKARPEADDDADEDDPEDGDDEMDDKEEIVAPKEGTPEWLVHEATALMLKPPPKTEDVGALKKYRRERNAKIINLSQKAIDMTQADKSKERILNVAVHNLMEARLQSALAGDREQVDALYKDAATLAQRAPESQAAAEGAHTLVNLAYNMAQASDADRLHWIREFAVQAQRFAEDYRNEERRSLPLLFTAGRSCELADQTKEALECYTLIHKGYSASPFAAQVGPMIKRLKLTGNPPQLEGPTIDGDHVAVDDLLGKVVLVVFWSTEVKPFLDQLPRLLAETRKQARRGLYVVGVNLDLEPGPVQQFVVKFKIRWPQIFFPESEKRGWNNPIVAHYGIMDIPAMWLIDQSGNVVSTSVKVETLASEIDNLLGQSAGGERSDAKAASKPANETPRESILERPGQIQKKKSSSAGQSR
jgi:hypothetical protein